MQTLTGKNKADNRRQNKEVFCFHCKKYFSTFCLWRTQLRSAQRSMTSAVCVFHQKFLSSILFPVKSLQGKCFECAPLMVHWLTLTCKNQPCVFPQLHIQWRHFDCTILLMVEVVGIMETGNHYNSDGGGGTFSRGWLLPFQGTLLLLSLLQAGTLWRLLLAKRPKEGPSPSVLLIMTYFPMSWIACKT